MNPFTPLTLTPVLPGADPARFLALPLQAHALDFGDNASHLGMRVTGADVACWLTLYPLTRQEHVYHVELRHHAMHLHGHAHLDAAVCEQVMTLTDMGGETVYVYEQDVLGAHEELPELPSARVSSFGVEFNYRPRGGEVEDTRMTGILTWDALYGLFPLTRAARP